MKKQMFFGILFFSAVWGLSEAFLGGTLYGFKIPHASILLSIIGFAILALARIFFPYLGVSTLIAAGAMLFKFFNDPVYKCHYLGVLMAGFSFDLFFGLLKIKYSWLAAIVTAFFNNTVFALIMTYVFHYQPWIKAGPSKIYNHIFISGSIVALAGAVLIPLCFRWSKSLQGKYPTLFIWQPNWAPRLVSLAGVAFWCMSMLLYIRHRYA